MLILSFIILYVLLYVYNIIIILIFFIFLYRIKLHDDEGCEGKEKRVFVINKAKVKDGHIVFYVSSKDIDPNSTNKQIKKLKKIPVGKFHNARFDIDSWNCCKTILAGSWLCPKC